MTGKGKQRRVAVSSKKSSSDAASKIEAQSSSDQPQAQYISLYADIADEDLSDFQPPSPAPGASKGKQRRIAVNPKKSSRVTAASKVESSLEQPRDNGGAKPISLYTDTADEDLIDFQPRTTRPQPSTAPSITSESSLFSLTPTTENSFSPLTPIALLPTTERDEPQAGINHDPDELEFFPERYIKQPRSNKGNVAYVNFNGPFPGVYYNWQTCEAAMTSIPLDSQRYLGYPTYSSAHAGWSEYQTSGILPHSIKRITPQDRKVANDAQEEMVRLRAAQDAAVERLPPLSSPLTAGPSRLASNAQAVTSSSPTRPNKARQRAAALPAQFPTTIPSKTAKFCVVFGGFAPGVYSSRASAEESGNDLVSNNDWATVPTYHAGTELFTRYFMLHRVHYLGRNDPVSEM